MTKVLFLTSCILFMGGGLLLTHWLKKKNLLPNRWLIGCLVFLVVLIPNLLFPNLPEIIKQGAYVFSGLLAVVFFESSRLLQEQRNQQT
ncbi:hypothetical protein [Candidatus Enterococcus ikei]|uniref:Uncharacterized protein n=1 Tax=Candidatus Enterococcus ikei TaxID=2815326 RepID=A0ABS3H049_9ENTE|nr:hypothetical protein [Enterococcus sp. DIV0869a]MBO0440465.1 hypothetical protein [Enterococcus sp. DIV0869a]